MNQARSTPGRIRIIGGSWRGRKIEVLDREGLRPTADRLRETLFNWLAPSIDGSVCLDLFSGSGALAFEALSRGAAHATLLDKDRAIVANLRIQADKLSTRNATIVHADTLSWLAEAMTPADIIFLDPPFESTLLDQSLSLLNEQPLKPSSQLYVECVDLERHDFVANGWQIARQGRTRHVQYALLNRVA